jgi:hypothetical protein
MQFLIVVDVLCFVVFFVEHVGRAVTSNAFVCGGLCGTGCSTPFLSTIDLLAWLPSVAWYAAMGPEVPLSTVLALSLAIVRILKFERYIKGFQILSKVLERSQGVLIVGGAAAAVVLVFSSALMYYAGM